MRNVLLIPSDDIGWQSRRAMLYRMEDVQVVGGGFDGDALAGDVEPDVVIAPVTLAGESSVPFLRTIRQRYPHSFIVVVGSGYQPNELVAFAEAGVRGYLVWSELDAPTLELCLRLAIFGKVIIGTASAGEAFFEAVLSKTNAEVTVQLTPRERSVLDLLAQGLTDKEIAERFQISTSTVASHIHTICTKVDAKTRFDLGMIALATGLVRSR
jgi:DNA-binding NarL/FixJ family response regulator